MNKENNNLEEIELQESPEKPTHHKNHHDYQETPTTSDIKMMRRPSF
jgi:hypothetical protein